MLYVLGERTDSSELPGTVVADLYRANEIETFNTCAVRVTTRSNVEVLYIVSDATESPRGPMFSFEFDEATVVLNGDQPTDSSLDGPGIYARFHDGSVKKYGSPDHEPHRKLWSTAASVRSGDFTACGIEAAMAQTMVMAAVHESVSEPVNFPAPLVLLYCERGRQKRWVEGLEHVLIEAYEQGRLPHEMGVPWAAGGAVVSVRDLPQHNPPDIRLRRMPHVHIPSLSAARPEAVG